MMEKPEVEETTSFIFKPNPGPQTDFLSANEQEVLYGGAAGGGKSYAMVADPVRYIFNPLFKGLLLRRTTEELRELIQISKSLYPKVDPNAKWTERDKTWYFSSGATLWMSYLERDDDVSRYQGQAFTWIGFDELTQWPTPYAWNYMRSRLRGPKGSNLPMHMRACVDEGEVLTENGWLDIRLVREGQRVQSVNKKGRLELKRVYKTSNYEVNEDLVRVRKKNLYMSMTPDHRVVYSKFDSRSRELVRFNEHGGKSISILRSSDEYTHKAPYKVPLNFDLDSYAEFLGWYVAEGSINQKVRKSNYKVIITQLKQQNHNTVRSAMEKSGCNVCYSKNGDFQINSKFLWEWLKPLGKSHEKHFPRDFLDNASRGQLEKAFKAYTLGDGHWSSPYSVSMTTVSDQLADDLQEICVKLGYKTQKTHVKLENEDHRDKWLIYASTRPPLTKVDKDPNGRNDTSYENYKGTVYCLSVEDNENFVIRQKGYVWISGNTSNPGGVGHHWVKKMFVDPSTPNNKFPARDHETNEILRWPPGTDKAGEPLFTRKFIPATLYDNPYLTDDGMYEANLLSLPEHQRKQLLEGNWDVNEGAAFPEWNRNLHIVDSFIPERNWTKFRACDYGYGSWSAVLWFAVEPSTEQLIVYRELFTQGVVAVDLADMILEAEEGDRVKYGVLDSSLWHNRGDTGPSLAEQMISRGCRWRPADRSKGSRVAGKNEIHRRLQVDEFTEQPRLVFMDNCLNMISQLPSVPLDKKNPDDVDTKYVDDHGYDALRYGIMSRPRSNIWDFNSFSTDSYRPVDPVFGF